jgi:hypothetical protein
MFVFFLLTLSTLGTQDRGRKQTIQRHCQHWAHKIQDENNQSRDTVNTGTQDRGKKQTLQRHCEHWAHKIQDGNKQSRDTVNTGHTRYRKKTNNPETL